MYGNFPLLVRKVCSLTVHCFVPNRIINDQDFIQAISIRLTNGFVVTGSYVGPQTKPDTARSFLKSTLDKCGDNQAIIGDLNARHITWGAGTNERGTVLTELANQTPGTYVLASLEPSYYKTVNTKTRKEEIYPTGRATRISQ